MTDKKSQKKKSSWSFEETRYVGAIPDEILEELTPEIIKQYYIWDEVMKREIELHPWLILPLIKEVFRKTYPEETVIRMIATEYVVRRIHQEEGSTLNSVYADIAVQIGKRDIYHLECQMHKDKGMVLRMLEYDIHIGLSHGALMTSDKQSTTSGMEMIIPRSVILYLNHTGNVPSEEVCLIRFADGTSCEYRVPVMKVQDYSLKMIEEKHLVMLIPFLPIRFRKYLQEKTISEEARKELTGFIRECIMIIEREKTNGTLTDLAGEDVVELLSVTCGYLFKSEPELYKEVHEIMNPTIKLTREIAAEEMKRIQEKAAEEIELIKEDAKAEVSKAEAKIVKAEEEAAKATEEAAKATEEATKAREEATKAAEKVECSIRKYIQIGQQNGQDSKEIQNNVQDIFSLSEAEAEEKMKEYWKN